MIQLKPDYYVGTVFDIDLDLLWSTGIRSLLLDLDNTIVAFQDSLPSAAIHDWVGVAQRKGFGVCIVSNSYRGRVQLVGDALGIPYVHMAKKPFRIGVVAAVGMLSGLPGETIMIGDQIFTDVLAARLAGVKALLVDPITQKDFFMTKIYRTFEYFVKRNLVKERMK